MPTASWITIVGSLGAAFLVLAGPSHTVWGPHHTPHRDKPPLLLTPGHTVRQTLRFEHGNPDLLVVWLDSASPRPTGKLRVTLETPSGAHTTDRPLADAGADGALVVPLAPGHIQGPTGTPAAFSLLFQGEQRERLALAYEIDSTRTPDGALRLDGRERQGDLAFRFRYRQPALGSRARQALAAFLLFGAGVLVSRFLRVSQGDRARAPSGSSLVRNDLLTATLSCVVAATFYGIFLLRPGQWLGPDDFTKDVTYLAEGAAALRAGAWPEWAHVRCGGMAFLGNPESSVLSLGTLLAVVLRADRALFLLLALEAGIGAAGAFLLARSLHLGRAAAIASVLVTTLSATAAYRWAEGWAMLGGVVAFLPWFFLFFIRSVDTGDRRYAVLAGLVATAMFYRGDIHVVIGLLLVAAVSAGGKAIAERSLRSLRPLVVVVTTFALFASVKVLPYVEQGGLRAATIPPYAAPLLQDGLLDDVFLRSPPAATPVRFLHAEQPDRFGTVGATVGPFALVLAGIGLLRAHRARRTGALIAITGLLLAEGTLYDIVLRHLGVVGTLLRIPSKQLFFTVLGLGILAGLGAEYVLSKTGPLRRLVAVLLLGLLTLSLVIPTSYVLAREFARRTHLTLPPPAGPTLTTYGPRTADPAKTLAVRAAAGYFLPWLCTEPFAQLPFTHSVTSDTPLADVPAHTGPNRITLAVADRPASVHVRTRAAPGWRTSGGVLLPREDGALSVLIPRNGPEQTTLTYRTSTAPAQGLLFLTFIILSAMLAAPLIRKSVKK